MIPHAALSLAGAVGTLLVTVIGSALVAGPVFPARLARCPRTPTVAASLATVRVAVIAPAVYPELVAALPAMSQSDFQWSSARPKNWTPRRRGRNLVALLVHACGAFALPPKARSANSGPSAFLPSALRARLDPEHARRHFHAKLVPGSR
jgi:hypothetical protein